MDSTIQDDERRHFSDRLKGALAASGYSTSPTAVAAEFNRRAEGAAVTVHGARKWLMGEAIPTQARIQILADWLNVRAAWLRYGDADNTDFPVPPRSTVDIDAAELRILKDLRLLSESGRALARDLVDSLLRNFSAPTRQSVDIPERPAPRKQRR